MLKQLGLIFAVSVLSLTVLVDAKSDEKSYEELVADYDELKRRFAEIDEDYKLGKIDLTEQIRQTRVLLDANNPKIESSKSEVGGTLCKYNDGTVYRIKGNACPRSTPKQTVKKAKLNRPYLKSQEGIVGGSKCFYSDGSITKIKRNYCPRKN